jgi:RecB family exonuclease
VSLDVTAVTAATAHRALAHTIAELKAGDPLRPVTVLVPTNAAGVMARRRLGRDVGIAAVDMITLYRLAERLAGPVLRAAHRLPVSTAVVELAVRSVLRDTATIFDDVADHPSTAVAVRELYRQLRLAGPASFDRLERASRRGRQVVAVARHVEARLAQDWYDEADLVRSATETVRSQGTSGDLGGIVVFLPQSIGPLDVELLTELGRNGSIRVLLGLTGDRKADRDLLAMAAALGTPVSAERPEPRLRPPQVVSLTDADEEARYAVRIVVDAARRGTPLASMAILWPADRPYARLVEHHLDQAGIIWNGRPGTLVSERLVPRFLLDLLDVDRRRLRRRDVFDLLADLPVRGAGGQPVPVAAWERASREAGVVRDEHWAPRLRSYANWQRQRAIERVGDDRQGGSDGAPPTHDDRPVVVPAADAAEALAAFVADLRSQLGRPSDRRTWSGWAEWSAHQIEQRIGIATIGRLDEAEFQAWEHTSRVLDRLRHLDAIGGPATRHEFRSVFAAEFDVAPGRLGRIGSGVTIGSLGGAAGLTADLVVVVGAAEGVMPSAPAIDPLLSDGERHAAGLATSESAIDRALRQLLGVVESAPELTVLCPRGDLRAVTVRQPSRWLAAIGDSEVVDIASSTAGLLASSFPATAHEHRLRSLTAGVLAEGTAALARSPDAVIERGLALRAGRRSDLLTVYDGDLSSASIPSFGRPVSPTQLQTWATCPHAYFVQYLLGVRAIEEPGDEIAITPADRGNALHEVLDLFHRDVIAGALPQPGPAGWGPVHLARLAELLTEVMQRFERTGRSGRAAYWELDGARIVQEIAGWVAGDSITSLARGAEVIASEVRFGGDGDVTLPLADGRRLAIYGTVDRIDRTPTGLIVTDHKSGSPEPYRAISGGDPTSGGTLFQLPAYAAAAASITRTDGPVRAEYSFFERGDYGRIGYEFDDAVWRRVGLDLQHVVDGIEAGWFPARPNRPQFEFRISCHYCQPDALGTAERFPEWERKRHDPRLTRWFAEPVADGAVSEAAGT